jgi:hypothetical protein
MRTAFDCILANWQCDAARMASRDSKLQVLCLHGHQQNGEIFKSRLQRLAAKLLSSCQMTWLNAPHELPLKEGQSVAMCAWTHDATQLQRQWANSLAFLQAAWHE